MRGIKTKALEINKIRKLRAQGYSISEIKKITQKSNSIVSKYIQGVQILPQYYNFWKAKRGASKIRSESAWEIARKKINQLIPSLDNVNKILILSCLYWGEGAKKDFSLSNTDPSLIKVFVECLKEIGIDKKELKVTIRLYEDLNKNKAINYWSRIIGIPRSQVYNVNILKGKKIGKLKYGMCRIRVTKGGKYFKLIQSTIELIKREINPL